jgi:hypothetical protein
MRSAERISVEICFLISKIDPRARLDGKLLSLFSKH